MVQPKIINEQTDLLIVGHYTHDTLIKNQQERFQRLGGGVAYVSAVAAGLKQVFKVISKVGDDFRYFDQCQQKPSVLTHRKTTSFVNYISEFPRRHQVNACCEPIYPHDIDYTADVAIVCGLMGEVLPETIQTLRERSVVLMGDVQGFIRRVDSTGKVTHTHLEETDYCDIISSFDYLKVSDEELPYINVSKLRENTTLLITYGDNGCTVYERKDHFHIPAYAVTTVDCTGAGDSFLAGVSIGLHQRLSLKEAIHLGHQCGRIAVQSIGTPAARSFSHLVCSESLSRPPFDLDKIKLNGKTKMTEVWKSGVFVL